MALSVDQVRDRVAEAITLTADGELDGGLALLDECVAELDASDDHDLDETWKLWVLSLKADLLREGGRNAEALETAALVINPYESAVPPPGAATFLARTLLTAAMAAYNVGDASASVRLCDELVRRYGQDEDPEVRAIVADGITAKGITFSLTGRPDEAVEAYRQVEAYVGDTDVPDLRERLAEALRLTGEARDASGRDADAARAYERLVSEFDERESPYIAERIRMGQAALAAPGS